MERCDHWNRWRESGLEQAPYVFIYTENKNMNIEIERSITDYMGGKEDPLTGVIVNTHGGYYVICANCCKTLEEMGYKVNVDHERELKYESGIKDRIMDDPGKSCLRCSFCHAQV